MIASGHPVVKINIADPYHIGQEFFRWEVATAVAGAVIGINPFDQPDVEQAKVLAREFASDFEKSGQRSKDQPNNPAVDPLMDPLMDWSGTESPPLVDKELQKFFAGIGRTDYFALLAFLEMNENHRGELQRIRGLVQEQCRVATCLGFGPRFQHSTGQVYKGGPNSGHFLQVTTDAGHDLPVPGKSYTFGQLQGFQAAADLQVLKERERRTLRIHLTGDVEDGLVRLRAAVQRVLGADNATTGGRA